MTINVRIIKGSYRGHDVQGVFPLVKGYTEGARGGFITIHNDNPKPGTPPVQRIHVTNDSFVLVDHDGNEVDAAAVAAPTTRVAMSSSPSSFSSQSDMVMLNYERIYAEGETDDDAMERISRTFFQLDRITNACAQGIGGIRGLVVSGPPGIGKSFGVRKQLDTVNLLRTSRGDDALYEIVSGGISPIGLYEKLYYNRNAKQVLVFDDCDGVLFEEESLNLLKAALNSDDRRRISWNKKSRALAEGDIPDTFDFEGSVIFLSNLDFERTIAKGSKIGQHLAAIISRCHFLDLEIGSARDKILRIRQMVRDGMLSDYEFKNGEEQEILDYIVKNSDYLREVSLRMVKKIADFRVTDPQGWEELVEATCLQKEAKFKRLLEARQIAEAKLSEEAAKAEAEKEAGAASEAV